MQMTVRADSACRPVERIVDLLNDLVNGGFDLCAYTLGEIHQLLGSAQLTEAEEEYITHQWLKLPEEIRYWISLPQTALVAATRCVLDQMLASVNQCVPVHLRADFYQKYYVLTSENQTLIKKEIARNPSNVVGYFKLAL